MISGTGIEEIIFFTSFLLFRMNLEGFTYNFQQTESKLEPELRPAKGAWSHYAGPMTSHIVINLPQVAISLCINLQNVLTVKVHLQDTQEISGTQLPCRRRERRMFFIHIAPSVSCAITALMKKKKFQL